MRRCDRPALRVQSLNPVALRSTGRWRPVRVLCDADAIELHRRWPADAICRVPGGH